jgi:Predicted redox protein, regulator of disulfide bond formation
MIQAKSGNEKYETLITDGRYSLTADTTSDKGGASVGFSPHDLLCAGFAACMNMTVRMLLEQRSLPYEDVTVMVDLERTDNTTCFVYKVAIAGELDEQTKEAVIRKAGNCPVHKTLSKEIQFRYDGEKTEAKAAGGEK